MTCPQFASAKRLRLRTLDRDAAPQRGAALLALAPITMLMVSLMLAFMGTTVDTSRGSTSALDSFRARAAAQSAASLAIADLWGDFEAIGGDDEQIWVFRNYLDGIGFADQALTDPPIRTNYMANLALAADIDGDRHIDGVEIERVDVHRIDNWDSTSLVVEVDAVMRLGEDGSSRERRSSIRETFTIAPPEWNGLDFALLANNVNCLLCHTTIDNVDRVYNQDSALYGSFDQVRVGSIESIHFRSDPDSSVAGVIMIGGDAIQGDGQNISDWSAFNLSSVDRFDGSLVEDAFGDLTKAGLRVFDSKNPHPDANLFLEFFSYGPDAAFGLELPETFPAPFPDNGGFDKDLGVSMPHLADNGIIDDSEFDVTTAGMSGTISGGDISVFKKGKKLNTDAEIAKLLGGNAASVQGVTEGNIYLHGTKDNPLQLDGDVAFDGDVIMSGYVKGRGTIRARGNVYVTSDIVYDDKGGPTSAFRTYGFADDGTENNLAIAAGGNIVIGDYYRPSWGQGTPTDGTKASSYNFTMEELAIFNRMEWMKTQPTLPGKKVWTQTGTQVSYIDEMISVPYTVNEPVFTKKPYEVKVAVYTKQPYEVKEPVFAKQPYIEMQPIYSTVKTGKVTLKPVYKKVKKTNGLPYPYTKTWEESVFSHNDTIEETKKVKVGETPVQKFKNVKVGTKTVTKYKDVQTGTKTVTKYKDVQTGTKEVIKYKKVPSGKKIKKEDPVKGWSVPQHVNPYFRPNHTPRYYNFAEGQVVPIFNKEGHYDPSTKHWLSDELAEGWDDAKLTYADPKDKSNSLLFDGSGKPAAVVSSVTPTNDWITPEFMRKIIQGSLAENPDGDKTIEIDATLYSSNAILGMIPDRESPDTNGRLKVNGGLVAADVGILAPMGTEVNYDVRGARALSITADTGLVINRRFSAPAVRY